EQRAPERDAFGGGRVALGLRQRRAEVFGHANGLGVVDDRSVARFAVAAQRQQPEQGCCDDPSHGCWTNSWRMKAATSAAHSPSQLPSGGMSRAMRPDSVA